MKTTNFLGMEISRLVVGGNPFAGYSYITDKITNGAMMDYYTADKIISALKYAETLGYTAFIATTCEFSRRYYRQYKNEGGTLKWIAQTHAPLDMRASVNNAIEGGAIAIFHQGTSGDDLFERKQLDTMRAHLQEMRRAGVPVGIATHVPGHIDIAENEFNVDFYMACLHNMRRDNEGRVSSSISGLKNEPHKFVYEDRALMFQKIRELNKPCIAFKILAGGNYSFSRKDLKQCMTETYSGIKPGDIATIGVFQRDSDQLKENALLLDEILSEI